MQSNLFHAFSKMARSMSETNEALAMVFDELAQFADTKGAPAAAMAIVEEQKLPTPDLPVEAAEAPTEAAAPKRRPRRTKAQIAADKAAKMEAEKVEAEAEVIEPAPVADEPISEDREYEPTVDEIREQIKTAIAKYGEEVKGRVRFALEELGYANMTALDTAGREAKVSFVKALNDISADLAAKA